MKRPIFLLMFTAILTGVFAFAQEKPAAKSSEQPAKAAAGTTGKEATVRQALSAAPTSIRKTATVKDWSGNTLKEGSSDYVCMPGPPEMKGVGPMCLDKVWQSWADAWMNKKDPQINGVGIAYMLQGDAGVSNTDPYAKTRTADNQWVVSGPHTMVLVPDKSTLDALPTDPNNGGPWVMWKGTPYAHIMVPVGGKAPMGTMGEKPKTETPKP